VENCRFKPNTTWIWCPGWGWPQWNSRVPGLLYDVDCMMLQSAIFVELVKNRQMDRHRVTAHTTLA